MKKIVLPKLNLRKVRHTVLSLAKKLRKVKLNKKSLAYLVAYTIYICKYLAWRARKTYKSVKKFILTTDWRKLPKNKLRWVKKNWKEIAIIGVSLPLLILASFLFFKWLTTPRPPTLRETSKKSYFLYQAKTPNYTINIGERSDKSPKVEFVTKKGSGISFEFDDARTKNIQTTKDGNKVVFLEVQPDIDVSYEPTVNGLKEELILNKQKEYPSIIWFEINLKNAQPKEQLNGFYGLEFVDNEGNQVFHFEKPFAYDSKNTRTNNISLQIREMNGKYYGGISLPNDWINAKERQFPIYIDPTITHDTSAEFATGQFNRAVDTGSGSSPLIETDYQESIADESTVGLWHFNETADNSCTGGTNDACDSSGNSLDGAASAGSTVNTSTQRLGAAARSYNGTTGYVTLPASGKLDVQRLTIEAWVYSTNYNVNMFIFEKTTNGTLNTQYSCFFNGTDTFYFRTYNSSNVADDLTVTTSTYIPNSTWNHIACVYDGAQKMIYVNGVVVSSKAYTQTLQSNAAGVSIIGAYGTGGGYFFNGVIDEVSDSR